MKLKKTNINFCIIVFLFTSVYFCVYRDFGANIWDEGVPLSGALRVQRGEKPLKDFIAYSPGRYLLYSASLKFADGNIQGPRTAMAIVGGIIAALIYSISVIFLGKIESLLPVCLYLLMPSPYYYRFFTLVLVVSILVLIRLSSRFSISEGLFLGVLGAFSGWFREGFGAILLTVMWLITIVKHRNDTTKITSWIPVLIASVGWLAKIIYVEGVSDILKGYAKLWGTAQESLSHMGLPWPPIWRLSYWAEIEFFYAVQDVLIWLPGLIIIIGFAVGFKYKGKKQYWWILWGYCLLGYGLVIWRTGFGNLQRCLPPIVIMAMAILRYLHQSNKKPLAFIGKMFGSMVCLFIFIDSIFVNPVLYDSIGLKYNTNNFSVTNPKMDIECERELAFLINKIDRSLQSVLDENDTLVCLPLHSLWNYLSGSLNPTYYEWLLPGMGQNSIRNDVLSQFQFHRPDVILINDIPFDAIHQRKFSIQYPELFKWIEREYYRWMSIYDFTVFRRTPDSSIHLFESDFSGELAFIEGKNHLDGLWMNKKKWPVIWQENSAKCGIAVTIPESAVLKTRVIVDKMPSAYNLESSFSVLVSDSGGESSAVFESTIGSLMENENEVIVDLESFAGRNRIIVFQLDADQAERVGWIDPVVFQLTNEFND